MKEYPLTEEQLEFLSHFNTLTTACFTVGGAFIGFAIDLRKDLQLATGVANETLAWWSGINIGAALAGGALFLVGGYFWWKKKSKLKAIKNATDFPGEP